MGGPSLYIIDYILHGEPKSFIIRAEVMNNSEAWHWASCDAGVGRIPKFGRERSSGSPSPLLKNTVLPTYAGGQASRRPGSRSPADTTRIVSGAPAV